MEFLLVLIFIAVTAIAAGVDLGLGEVYAGEQNSRRNERFHNLPSNAFGLS